eukprot:SAG25_NODE_5629_length_636_cov_1.344507_2_plen_76_part_01
MLGSVDEDVVVPPAVLHAARALLEAAATVVDGSAAQHTELLHELWRVAEEDEEEEGGEEQGAGSEEQGVDPAPSSA